MAVHMDCLHWVNRDSYLPQGSRGLKVGGGCEGAGWACGAWLTDCCPGTAPRCCRGVATQRNAPAAPSLPLQTHLQPLFSTPTRCSLLKPRPPQMVTKYKLGYDPVEVDPEDMVRCACCAALCCAALLFTSVLQPCSAALRPRLRLRAAAAVSRPQLRPALPRPALPPPPPRRCGWPASSRRPWPPTRCRTLWPPTTST